MMKRFQFRFNFAFKFNSRRYDMAQLDCGGCRTRLMYVRGAASVQCSVCNTVNLAMQANQVAHCQCGGCRQGLTLVHIIAQPEPFCH